MPFVESIRLSVGILTVVPVGALRTFDRRVAGTAMMLAPLAVLPVALAAAGLGWLSQVAGWPPLVGGLLAVGALVLGTRALHLDGLADTVDGLGSGSSADRALAVMRQGDIGPMGVIALVLVLSAQVAAAGTLSSSWQGATRLAVLVCCSRAALLQVCRRGVPAARADGLGASVAGTVTRGAAVALGTIIAAVVIGVSSWAGDPWWLGLLSVTLAAAGVALLVRRCVHRFGGVTGDVMGAAVELAFTGLVVAAIR